MTNYQATLITIAGRDLKSNASRDTHIAALRSRIEALRANGWTMAAEREAARLREMEAQAIKPITYTCLPNDPCDIHDPCPGHAELAAETLAQMEAQS